MNVYIITTGQYDDFEIVEAHTNRRVANKRMRELSQIDKLDVLYELSVYSPTFQDSWMETRVPTEGEIKESKKFWSSVFEKLGLEY